MPTCHPFPLVIQRHKSMRAGTVTGHYATSSHSPLPTPPAQPDSALFIHKPRVLPHAARSMRHTVPPLTTLSVLVSQSGSGGRRCGGRKCTKCERAATLIPPWVMEANRIESNRMVQNGIRPSKGRTTTCDAQAMTMVKPASRQTVIHVVPHITHPKLPGSGSPLPLSLVKPPATRTCSHFVGMDQWRVNSLHLVKKRPI